MTLISKFLSEEKAEKHKLMMEASGYTCNIERATDYYPKRKVFYVFSTETSKVLNRD